MKYKPLGNTGLYVSQLCLGAMTFSRGEEPTAKALGATGDELAGQMAHAQAAPTQVGGVLQASLRRP